MTQTRSIAPEMNLSSRENAVEQYKGIRALYKELTSLTTMEERRGIAGHYEWINPQNPDRAVCRRIINSTDIMTPALPNCIAYHLCDEYRLSEAGLVRDTLIQDQQLARFNRTVRMVNDGELSPGHINMGDLVNVVDTLLKYDVLGTPEFREELLDRNKPPIRLRQGSGQIIEDAGSTFFEMIDELQTSMGLLNRNGKTKALINQALDILSFRVNSKVAHLGAEQGIERLAGIAASNEGLKALRGIVDGMIARMQGVNTIIDQSVIPTQPIPVPRQNLIDGHSMELVDYYPIEGFTTLKQKAVLIKNLVYKGREGNLRIIIRPNNSRVIQFLPEKGRRFYEWLPFDPIHPGLTEQIVMEQLGLDLSGYKFDKLLTSDMFSVIVYNE